MNPTDIDKIGELAEPVLRAMGLELVEVEFKREGRDWFLRFFIDKEGGVTLDDCAAFSREIDAVLEVEALLPEAYRLEVSSPGLDRPLKKEDDFRRFAGQQIKLKSRERIDPDERGHLRKTFVGELLGLENGVVRLRQTDKKGGEIEIPLEGIEHAHLEPEF
ncbi:MAG: ribosome maturation factor [Desulfuromonadales bacterium]|nr:ribosome maturation factor [Desulfuromonadales bacterium]